MAVPLSNLTASFANSSLTYTGIGLNVTSSAYATGTNLLNLKVNDESVFSVDVDGVANAAGGLLVLGDAAIEGSTDILGDLFVQGVITSANLSSANIAIANISSVKLTTANIATANISTANIATANITSANLISANIGTANITTATITTLTATSIISSTVATPGKAIAMAIVFGG